MPHVNCNLKLHFTLISHKIQYEYYILTFSIFTYFYTEK
jgi:hypothetical protein